MCAFRNLRFNAKSRVFEYVVPRGAAPPVLDLEPQTSAAVGHGRDGFLRLHSGFERGKPSRSVRWYEPLPLRVRRADRVDPSERHIEGVHQLWAPTAPSSFGHMMFDNLHPIFQARLSLGYAEEDVKLVLMSSCAHYPGPEACSGLTKLYPETVTSGPALVFDELVGRQDVVFTSVIAGGGGYAGSNYHATCKSNRKYGDDGYKGARGLGLSWWLFREHVYRRHGLDPDARPAKHQILIMDKSGTTNGAANIEERRFMNLAQVERELSKLYPRSVVRSIDLSKYSFHENLQVMLNTTIFVSQWGSVSHRVPFLPFNAAAIVCSAPARKCDGETGSRNVEVINNFMYYGHVHAFMYLPQLPELTNTQERDKWYREKCDGKGTFLRQANFNLNIPRLSALIDEAVRRMVTVV